MEIWRITQRRFADNAFSGGGARQYGGRWNSVGTSVVYCSATKALATLELLTRLEATGPLGAFVCIAVQLGEELIEPVPRLPDGWAASPPGVLTRQIGDAWVKGNRSVALAVPSVIVPSERNYLLSPGHPYFAGIRIGATQELVLDPRLLKITAQDQGLR